MATQSLLASDAAKPQGDDEPPQVGGGGGGGGAGESPSPGAPLTPVTSISTSTSSSTSISNAAPPPASPASSPSPAVGPAGAANPAASAPRAPFAGSPGFVVPAQAFSYSVLPRALGGGGGSGGVQQPAPPAPDLKLGPPMPTTALQPPVPGQYLGNRPSFSYNVLSHANPSLPTGQQFQLSTAANHAVQGSKFIPPASLQPPAPGQLTHSNAIFSGAIAPNTPAPIRVPLPVPPKTSNLHFGVNLLQESPEASQNKLPPSTGNSDVVASKSDASCTIEAISQPIANAAGNPSNPASMPTNPSFPPRPGAFGGVGPSVPGQPSPTILSASAGIPGTPIPPLRPSVPSPAPLPQTSTSVATSGPVIQGVQQQFYPAYPSGPGVIPPPQPLWVHPPQATGLQHAPFQLYPGGPPGPFPRPMAAAALSATPSSNIQPPVASTVGDKEPASTNTGSDQTRNASVEEPSPTDQENKTNDLQKEEGTTKPQDSDVWSAHKTETGVVYYYNAVTGESTYQRPAGFKGETEKITAQSVPASWEKLDGTDWSIVMTNDGKKYYYDNKNKVSCWQLPPEVAELTKNIENDSLKTSSTSLQDASAVGDKGAATLNMSSPAVQTGGRDSLPLRQTVTPPSSSALDLIKKKLQDAGASSTPSTLPASSSDVSELNGSKAADAESKGHQVSNISDKSKDNNGDGSMSDSSSESDDEERGPSKEECIRQFKEMLKERGVAPFSKWEKELPKIVFDPRFKAVPSYSTRRAIFDHYVRTRAEEERKEKRAAQKAAVEAFKQLLEEASEDIDHKTGYQEFKRKWGSDPRFQALDRRERETLFNEKVKAAEEKIQSMRNAVITSFKSMLRESKDITSNSRWSKVKEGFRSDPRYKAVKHEEREILFNEYIAELKSAEDEAERAAKAKMDEQAKLREREREMRKRKEREEQEMERVKLKIRKKEAIASYQALLVEMIKDPKASWTESKPKLEKDPQGRATNPDLAQGDAEKLFRDHVKDLHERCTRDFRALLAEVITTEAATRMTDEGKTVISSWSEAKRLLKPDPRYAKLSSKDKESIWQRYADDMARKLKQSDTKKKSDTDGRHRTSSDPSRRR